MPIFDSHCHYNLEPFNSNWEKYWQKAQENNVTDSTVVGVDIETSKVAIQLTEKDSHFHAVIGCHPGNYQERIEKKDTSLSEEQLFQESLQFIESEKKELEMLLNSRVKAFGETGLDYFRLPASSLAQVIKKVQKEAFKMHIELAQKNKLPLVIHVRDTKEEAYFDVLDILQEYLFGQPFVLHCVSGPSLYIQKALSMGAYLGLAGNLTYKNSEHLRELATFAPADQLLIETDAPFLPPVPYRGKPCEPWMINQTAAFLEQELDLDLGQIYQNSLNLFKVKIIS